MPIFCVCKWKGLPKVFYKSVNRIDLYPVLFQCLRKISPNNTYPPTASNPISLPVIFFLNLTATRAGTFQKNAEAGANIQISRVSNFRGLRDVLFTDFSNHSFIGTYKFNGAAVFRSGHDGRAVRALRGCNGAAVALRRGCRCTTKAAPLRPREALTARKRRLFGLFSAVEKHAKSLFRKSRKGLTASVGPLFVSER